MKFHISAASNTMAACWVVLEDLGYTVSIKRVKGNEMWVAERDQQGLTANDPCTLLGLVKLVEKRGEDWQVSDEQIAIFLRRFYEAD